MKNVRQKICENVLPYIFYYSGVSINKISILDTFSYPRGMYMISWSPYYEKRKAKSLQKIFALRFLLKWSLY